MYFWNLFAWCLMFFILFLQIFWYTNNIWVDLYSINNSWVKTMLKIPRIYVDQNIVNYKFFFVGNFSFKFGKILVTLLLFFQESSCSVQLYDIHDGEIFRFPSLSLSLCCWFFKHIMSSNLIQYWPIPWQVVVGSFITDGRKESKSANHMEPLNAPSKLGPGGGHTGASSPPSRGTLSESSGGPGSPLNHSTGACNNSNPQGMSSMAWK